MVLREATAADVDHVIALIRDLVEAVGGPQSVDEATTRATVLSLIASPMGVVFVTPGGFIAGMLSALPISPDLWAHELGWRATDRSGLRLLRAFEAWADSHGARVRLSTGPDGPDLARLGYRPAEMAWVR